MKYIIIGGVAGGATAAARLRRVDEKSDILLFEKGKYISYANCGLPYYIGGVIAEREKLLVQTPTSFGQRFRVDVRVKKPMINFCCLRVLHLFDHHWKVSILKEFSLSVMLKIPII